MTGTWDIQATGRAGKRRLYFVRFGLPNGHWTDGRNFYEDDLIALHDKLHVTVLGLRRDGHGRFTKPVPEQQPAGQSVASQDAAALSGERETETL